MAIRFGISAASGVGGGINDHGQLNGLADDDHTQYTLADGTRPFTGTVGGITPVADADLVTKAYVDSNIEETISASGIHFAASGHTHALDDLTDVSTAGDDAPDNQDVLTWFSASGMWIPAPASGSSANLALDDLTDVTITSPQGDHILAYINGEWVNVPSGHVHLEEDIVDLGSYALDNHEHTLDDLTDVSSSGNNSPLDGEVLIWVDSSGRWIPAAQTGDPQVLNDLLDVTITSPQGDHVLAYINGEWVNAPSGHTHLEEDILDLQNYSLSNHQHNLDDLTDVDTSGDNTPADNQVLTWFDASGRWVPADATGGGGGGATELDDLTDVTITSPLPDEVLSYDGAQWVNKRIETGLWDPSNLPSGVIWLDPTGLAGHTENDEILFWHEKLNDFHAVQTTPNGPRYEDPDLNEGQNGWGMIRTDDFDLLEFPTWSEPTGSFFFTYVFNADTDQALLQYIFSATPDGSVHDLSLFYGSNVTGKMGWRDSSQSIITLNDEPNPGVLHVVSWLFDAVAGSGFIYIDGSYASEGVYVPSSITADPNFGAGPTGSNGFGGRIGEFIVANAFPSVEERQKTEGYLAHKWFIASGLPSDHPYVHSPPGLITTLGELTDVTLTATASGDILEYDGDVWINTVHTPPSHTHEDLSSTGHTHLTEDILDTQLNLIKNGSFERLDPKGEKIFEWWENVNEDIWTPAIDQTGIALWLRADDLDPLWDDGELFNVWPEAGPSGATLTTVSSQRMTFHTNVVNGLPVARGIGANDHINHATLSFPATTDYSVFWTANIVEGTTGAEIMIKPEEDLQFLSTASPDNMGYRASGDSHTFGPIRQGEWLVVSQELSATNASGVIRRNGIFLGEQAYTATALNADVGICANNNGGNAITGDLQELIFLTHDIEDFERQRMEGYLAYRVNIQNVLAADHPYRLNTPKTFGASTSTSDSSVGAQAAEVSGSLYAIRQNDVPLLSEYQMLSLQAKSDQALPTGIIDLHFKDDSHALIQTITLNTPVLTSSYVRYSDDGTWAWVIAPSGADPVSNNLYNPNAKLVDIAIHANDKTVQIDEVMMEAVSASGTDGVWDNFYNTTEAPSTFYDSILVDDDRIMIGGEQVVDGAIAGSGAGFKFDIETGIAEINKMAGILEVQRRETGPYVINKIERQDWQPTASSMWVHLDEDPLYLGGVEHNNFRIRRPETLRRFKIEYHDPDTTGYIKWDDQPFQLEEIDGVKFWVTSLDRRNVAGSPLGTGVRATDLSSLDFDKFTCVKDWDTLPIWNGCVGAINFRVDDGHVVTATGHAPVLDNWDVNMSHYIPTNRIETADRVTWEHLRRLVDTGHEVSSHARSLAVMVGYEGGNGQQGYLDPKYQGTGASGINWVTDQIVNSKRILEDGIRWFNVENETDRLDYECKGFAYPGHLRDGFVTSLVAQTYDYGCDGDSVITGSSGVIHGIMGANDSAYPSWNNLRIAEISKPIGAPNWFFNATGNYADVYTAVTADLDKWDYSDDGDPVVRFNPILQISWHSDADVLPLQLNWAMEAIRDHSSKWWVDSMANIIDYWKKAHRQSNKNLGAN